MLFIGYKAKEDIISFREYLFAVNSFQELEQLTVS